jgi:acyl-CoA synthetase (NDP forming)
LPEDIRLHVRVPEAVGLEMLEQLFKSGVREALLVVEVHVLKHAPEALVRVFNGVEGRIQVLANVGGVLPDIRPEMPFGNVKPMLVRISGKLGIAVLLQAVLVLLLPDIAESLIEKETKDIMFIVGGIDSTPQDVSGSPEMSL